MELRLLELEFCICKIHDITEIDKNSEFLFLAKTDEELSLVCESGKVPSNTIKVDDGWRCFRIEGLLDFSLIGILSNISQILADAGISIFAISTYNTDYILVKKEDLNKTIESLSKYNYDFK